MQQQLLKQSSFQQEKKNCKLLRELVNKLNKNGIYHHEGGKPDLQQEHKRNKTH